MHLLTLGLNHQSAPLAMRERVAFAGESLVKAAHDLKLRAGELLRESAILSTCNRTEIYCATPQPQAASQASSSGLPLTVDSKRAISEAIPTRSQAIKPYDTLFGWPVDSTRWCWAKCKSSVK